MADPADPPALHGDPLFSLDGKIAVVTAGATGIGAEITRTLAGHGARVAFSHRGSPQTREDVERTRDEVAAATGNAPLDVVFDVRSVRDLQRGFDQVVRHFGRVDILVNNAGTNVQQLAVDVDEETWDLILDTNLKGVFFCSQAAARAMRAQESRGAGYAIVNVASQMGLVGYYRRAAYCASKAGVVNLTRVLAIEWAGDGIRVNAVAPSFIETPLSRPMLADETFHSEVLRRTPLGRIGKPIDVASGVLYLCSPAAGLVTGHTLSIDGGWTSW